jgi:hypothetical protein
MMSIYRYCNCNHLKIAQKCHLYLKSLSFDPALYVIVECACRSQIFATDTGSLPFKVRNAKAKYNDKQNIYSCRHLSIHTIIAVECRNNNYSNRFSNHAISNLINEMRPASQLPHSIRILRCVSLVISALAEVYGVEKLCNPYTVVNVQNQ